MNKTVIKNFAIWARRKLISEITYKAGLVGITEKGIKEPLPMSTANIQFFDIGTGRPKEISNHEIKQRKALVDKIREKESTSDYKTAFQYVIEEVAYTWFNRLIAIRFMEVNGYLPSGVRVLSSETAGKAEPDMVTTPFETDMDFTPYEKDRIIQLKDENKLDELFRMLFIKQCNKLNEILPELFEKTADYTELLLTISFTHGDGIVSHLVNDIKEKDFTEAVEIIGWLYQYYNTEPKDEVFALLKKNVKITKERIPAATQLFTPDWIVRYMVENSLGRLWIERERAKSEVSDEYLNGSYFGWKYYLEEAEQEESVKVELERIRAEYKELNPEDIKIIDPCMGSGHIIVYAFDVLMQIYESQGYTQRDAAIAIIENNLYGLDIDDRAYQLAYFAVMMKARKHDRRFFTRGIIPNLYSIEESNTAKRQHLKYFGAGLSELEYNNALNQMNYLLDTFKDAKEYGSILKVNDCSWELLRRFVSETKQEGQISFDAIGIEKTKEQLLRLIDIGQTMAQKYNVVVTNPPYMGSSGMDGTLSEYVKANYPDSKTDLFAVFIERCRQMTEKNGFQAMITQHTWMFLSSFEKLRLKLLNIDMVNMAHLGPRAFEEIGGEVVQTTSFVLRKSHIKNHKGVYCRLIEPTTQQGKEEMYLAGENRYATAQNNFSKIPGSPIAYWVSEKIIEAFANNQPLGQIAEPRQGMATADNNRFLRLWFEVSTQKTNRKWYPYSKGGSFRKWYGNGEYFVNWENDGAEIKSFPGSVIRNPSYYFKHGLAWSALTSGSISFRYLPEGYLFDSKGPVCFPLDDNEMLYLLGLVNSNSAMLFLQILAPTLDYNQGPISKIPTPRIINKETVKSIVESNITLSRLDWDSFETSWDFKRHPLVPSIMDKQEQMRSQFASTRMKAFGRLSWHYNNWKRECEGRFNTLKANEEELNRIFINIYGLEDELTPEVEDKDVTVARIYDTKEDIPENMKGNKYVLTKQDVIKSFVSYAVGCIFGRYSLDVEGLAYAGGDWDDSKYKTFIPDKDNCLPITDEEYMGDDIVGRFVEFVQCLYGRETLEENLDFIAMALGNKGDTSREIIRNYFVKDFYKDHVKTYKKRPIYWLYDSGRQDGFKALIYMHRYHADTTGLVRVDYLHRMQKIYESEIDRMKDLAENSKNAREVARAEKRREKLIKQLKETKEYDEKIAHLAPRRIEIDLDDGVKVNYEKVQTDANGRIYHIFAKI